MRRVIIITVLRIVAFRTALNDVANASWRYTGLEIYTSIEMHYSLIAATIPCMHVFLKNFNTGYLGTTADQIDPTGTLSGGGTKNSNSYAMSTVRSRHNDTRTSGQRKGGVHMGRDDGKVGVSVGVSARKTGHQDSQGDIITDAESATSDGSDKIIGKSEDYMRSGDRRSSED